MKKQIIAGLAAAMVCVGAVGGTFAYLTQQTGPVTNTFTVGNNVKISLDESTVTQLGVVDGDARTNSNIYKLMPDHEYVKDPTVHIPADSESCYVFIHVDNGIEDIEAPAGTIMADNEEYVTIADQITNNSWIAVPGKDDYYYKKNAVTPAGTQVDLVVFGEFMINEEAYIDENETPKNTLNLSKYNGASITITACAVQADGFANATDAVAAWPNDFDSVEETPVEPGTDAPTE